MLRASEDFEVCEPQSLGIVCFRLAPPAGGGSGDLNAFNKAALERVQLGGSAFLSSTVLDGMFWLRARILNPRTTPADIVEMIEAIRRAGADIRATAPP
jgi:glutamate/tyrosine decarboxylase-like PLP-dependent enzyme